MYAMLRCGGNLPLCVRTRYQKQAFTVRNMRAVLKKASWGTRRIFGSICLSLKKVDSQQRVNNGVFTHPETVQLL